MFPYFETEYLEVECLLKNLMQVPSIKFLGLGLRHRRTILCYDFLYLGWQYAVKTVKMHI